tara:strand:+ start:457 stop:1377 length:921 start_codon:yes stop_codon:yes gene_type:complete
MTLKQYINNNFEKVYFINVNSRADRRDRCIELFKKYDIYDKVERIPGKVFTEEEITRDLTLFTGHKNHLISKKFSYTKKVLARWGCTTSHLHALQHAKDNNIEKVLILEDDIEIYTGHQDTVLNYEEVLFNANKTLQNIKWDLHYLGYYPAPLRGCWSDAKVLGSNIFTGKFLQSSHAIGYSKRAYNKFLDDMLPSLTSFKWRELGGTIDEYLSFVFQTNSNYITTAIAPIMMYQRPSYSDIQQDTKNYGSAYLKNNIIMLRDRAPDNYIRFPVKKSTDNYYKMNKQLLYTKISKEEYEKYTTDTF